MSDIEVTRGRSGAIRLTLTTEDGLTFVARQSPITSRSGSGRFLDVRGPLEHKRPQVAGYDLETGLLLDWPENNRDERRRVRFNAAAWALIREAERQLVTA